MSAFLARLLFLTTLLYTGLMPVMGQEQKSQSLEIEIARPIVFVQLGGHMAELFPRLGETGLIVTADGIVIFPEHTARSTSEIRMLLSDGRRFNTSKFTIASRYKVGIAKLDIDELPIAKIGDPAGLVAGDPVFLIVASLNEGPGLAHRKFGKLNPAKDDAPAYVQSTAPGVRSIWEGPLFNQRGELIAFNIEREKFGPGAKDIPMFGIPSQELQGIVAEFRKYLDNNPNKAAPK